MIYIRMYYYMGKQLDDKHHYYRHQRLFQQFY